MFWRLWMAVARLGHSSISSSFKRVWKIIFPFWILLNVTLFTSFSQSKKIGSNKIRFLSVWKQYVSFLKNCCQLPEKEIEITKGLKKRKQSWLKKNSKWNSFAKLTTTLPSRKWPSMWYKLNLKHFYSHFS